MPNVHANVRRAIADGEVHLWLAALPAPPAILGARAAWLSPPERAKADAFYRPADRDRYVASHLLLRQWLSDYTGIPPARLRFREIACGKPALDHGSDVPNIQFNLSHAGERVLGGFTARDRIGVDLEPVREPPEMLAIARRFFTPAEADQLERAPVADRARAFFRCWTRKEAFVKARGEGLSCPLDRFEVAFGADEAPGIRWVADDPTAPERWTVLPIAPSADYLGAAVVEGHPSACRYFEFDWHTGFGGPGMEVAFV